MIKRLIFLSSIILIAYIVFLFSRINITDTNIVSDVKTDKQGDVKNKLMQQTVYSFTFSKYSPTGRQELEIDGDSADILAKVVKLTNVIAKAYANDTPITITADKGVFNRETSNIDLSNNVVATSEEGATFKSESLKIDVRGKILSTEDKAKIEKDNVSIKGKGAIGDSKAKKLKFNKNVTVVINTPNNDIATTITCDGPLEVDYIKNIAHFKDNVVATDNKGKLTADSMDVFYDKKSKQVYKIVAMGNVIIEQDGNMTYSDNVIYLAEQGRIILGGNPEAIYYPNRNNNENIKENKDKNDINNPFDFLSNGF